jgi:site-specific DNA-methyltransferase (adenine-specific)
MTAPLPTSELASSVAGQSFAPASGWAARSYYQDALVTLYLGDCRELIPLLDWSTHSLVTDPPYGVTDHEWDEVVPAAEWMRTKCAVVTASEPYATQLINSAPLKFGFDCVWVKNCVSNAMNAARMPMRRHERVLVFGDYEWTPQKRRRSAEEMARLNQKQRETMQWATPDTVLEYDSVNCRHGERTEHPSQKPVPLMEYLIKSFTSGIVCDPFAGSGSTLVAAKCAGRQIIGIERNEKFCELAARRCSQEMALVPPNGKLRDRTVENQKP